MHKIEEVKVYIKVMKLLWLAALIFYVRTYLVSGDINPSQISFLKIKEMYGHAAGQS